MENCSLVQILEEFHPERVTYKNLAELVLLNGLSKFDQNFTVGFLKIAFYSLSPQCHLGNFPYIATTNKYRDTDVIPDFNCSIAVKFPLVANSLKQTWKRFLEGNLEGRRPAREFQFMTSFINRE